MVLLSNEFAKKYHIIKKKFLVLKIFSKRAKTIFTFIYIEIKTQSCQFSGNCQNVGFVKSQCYESDDCLGMKLRNYVFFKRKKYTNN